MMFFVLIRVVDNPSCTVDKSPYVSVLDTTRTEPSYRMISLPMSTDNLTLSHTLVLYSSDTDSVTSSSTVGFLCVLRYHCALAIGSPLTLIADCSNQYSAILTESAT
jgi:hypothetical protein